MTKDCRRRQRQPDEPGAPPPHVWRKPRETVIIFCPPEADEAPSWLRGTITESTPPQRFMYAHGWRDGPTGLEVGQQWMPNFVTACEHLVLCAEIKWLGGEWGPYDGVPLIVAREYEGGEEILEYVACVREVSLTDQGKQCS